MTQLVPNQYFPGSKIEWKLEAQGFYERHYPQGAVIHFTAGSSPESSLEWAKKKNYAFWLIDDFGTVYCTHPVSMWGHHCGKSSWPGLGENLSNKLIGIELTNPGLLEDKGNGVFRSYFGLGYQSEDVRVFGRGEANIQPGAYKRFTEAQESKLIELILWLHRQNPEVFKLDLCLGHDEISPKRKNDPGGALSMTMPTFRELLRSKANKTAFLSDLGKVF